MCLWKRQIIVTEPQLWSLSRVRRGPAQQGCPAQRIRAQSDVGEHPRGRAACHGGQGLTGLWKAFVWEC